MISTEQQAVIAAVQARDSHVVVEATAGSGKTTTLVHIAKALGSAVSACFLAFNRSAARELARRLPAHAVATTLHALGYAMIKAHTGTVTLRPTKQYDLALPLITRHVGLAGELAEISAAYLAQLATILRTERASVTQLPELAKTYALTPPVSGADLAALHALLPRVLRAGTAQAANGIVDYPDLLYQPVLLRCTPPRYDVVCVDEAQDLSPASLALTKHVLHPGTTAVFVGDPHQAIYGFAGAKSAMLRELTSTLPARRFPLSVSFRCPARHVLLARGFSPEMTPRPGAPMGSVRLCTAASLPTVIEPDSLVLARRNEELLPPFFALLRAGVPVHVLGLSTRAWAQRVLTELAAVPGRTVRGKIQAYTCETQRRLERTHVLSVHLGQHLADLQTDVELLWSLAHGAERAYGTVTVEQLHAHAKQCLGNRAHSVVLSTIHKAKGREAAHVYVLHPEWFHVTDSEEENLLFVALTRAKESLTFVSAQPRRILQALPAEVTAGDRVWRRTLELSTTFAKPPGNTWVASFRGVLSRYERSRRVQSSWREARGRRPRTRAAEHRQGVH